MINTTSHFTGTYAKALIADWTVIADIIRERTLWIRDTITADAETIPLLSDQQLDDAFNGPFYVFFKQHLSAYAAISRIETALTISKEDIFKEAEHITNPTLSVPSKLLDKSDFSTLAELRNQLNVMVKAHYTEWKTQLQIWEKNLLDALQKNNVGLSDLELQDFTINQPLSELEDRIINLKVAIPKLSKSDFNFEQYWKLKTMLSVQSALSRTQLPHTEKEIDQQLNSLKSIFKSIANAETTLQSAQQKAVEQLIKQVT